MTSLFKLIVKHPLFGGSLVMIIGSNITNFINYIYHVAMGRVLPPAQYGELATLLSLSGLIGIIPGCVSLAIVKFVSSASGDNEVAELVTWFKKKSLTVAVVMFLLILIFSPIMGKFLHISNLSLIWLMAATFLFSVPTGFNRSILQGLIHFGQLVSSILVENLTRLGLGVALVILGYSVFGVVMGIFLATVLGWIMTHRFLSKYTVNKVKKLPNLTKIFHFTIPVMIFSFTATSLYSVDLLLVKHFFSSQEAGAYAAMSILGRIILFGSGPIGAVMFPLVSQRKARKQEYMSIFYYSFILTALLSTVILSIYYFWPQLVVSITYNQKYLEMSQNLVWFGLFATMFTLANLLMSFYLSIGKVRSVTVSLAAALIQVILIWFFHQDVLSVIKISTFVASGMLVTLMLYQFIFKGSSK